jgi:hypothetical protein
MQEYPSETHVSPHFLWSEFGIAPDTTPQSVKDNVRLLCIFLEAVRAGLKLALGAEVPITITSGWRPSATHSDHKYGNACDLKLPASNSREAAKLVLQVCTTHQLDFDQLIWYEPGTHADPSGTHVHVGVRIQNRNQVLRAYPNPANPKETLYDSVRP